MRGARIRASILANAPSIGPEAFRAACWDGGSQPVMVLEAVKLAQDLQEQVRAFAPHNASSVDWAPIEAALAELPPGFTQDRELALVENISKLLGRAKADLNRLSNAFGESAPLTVDSAHRLVAMAERAVSIPALQREALVSNVWERGIESIAELVVESHEVVPREAESADGRLRGQAGMRAMPVVAVQEAG